MTVSTGTIADDRDRWINKKGISDREGVRPARGRTLVAVAEAKLQVMAEQLPLVQMTQATRPLSEIDEGQEEQQATEQAEDLVLEPGQQHLVELGMSTMLFR